MNLKLALFGPEEARLSYVEIIALIDRLPEGSRFISELHDPDDWREYLGADAHYMALAGIYEAVNQNTRATGNWKGKPPRMDPWPTPGIAAERAKKSRAPEATTLDDIFRRLSGMPGAYKE